MTSTRESTRQNPRYATLVEAVEYCRSSRRSLERRIAEGKLTRYKNGFRVLVDLNEIDSLLRGDLRQSVRPTGGPGRRIAARRGRVHEDDPEAAIAHPIGVTD